MRTWMGLATFLLAAPALAAAAETVISLTTTGAAGPGEIPEGVPTRFVLLDDGQVFVGGTSEVASGRLEKKETKEIEKLVERVKKMPGIGAPQTLGPGERTYRL